MHPHLVLTAHDLEAPSVARHEEGAQPLVALGAIRHREEKAQARLLAAGDEALDAAYAIEITLAHGGRGERGGVRTRARLRQRESADARAVCEAVQEFFLLPLAAVEIQGIADQGVVRGENRARRGTRGGDFFCRQRHRDGVRAAPAVGIRHREAHQPEFPHALHDLGREAAFVYLRRHRGDLTLTEIAHHLAHHLLLVVQETVVLHQPSLRGESPRRLRFIP